MNTNEIGKQVRSFVSFALAVKPSIMAQRHCANEALPGSAIEFKLSDKGTLSKSEVSSLESMIKKYEPIKEYLHICDSPEDESGFNIATCSPTVTFQPDVEYQILKLNSEQLKVAKEVARRVDHTYKLHIAKDHAGAKEAHKNLHHYLEQQRAELIGDFKNVHKITEVVGMHGVGKSVDLMRRADFDCGGAVIFVIIEIFVM